MSDDTPAEPVAPESKVRLAVADDITDVFLAEGAQLDRTPQEFTRSHAKRINAAADRSGVTLQES